MIASAVEKVVLVQSPAQAAEAVLSRAVFHIFNNSPPGRENLLQSAYLAKQFNAPFVVYLPTATQCLLHCERNILTLTLSADYVRRRTTARRHVEQVFAEFGVDSYFYQPADFTAGILPHLPAECSVFAFPTAASIPASRLRLGQSGSKVQWLARRLGRPMLMAAAVFRPWTRVAALAEGAAAPSVIRAATSFANRARVPLAVHAPRDAPGQETLHKIIRQTGSADVRLHLHQSNDPADYLYAVSRDSLVIVGIGNRSKFRDLLWANPLSRVRALLPNPLLVVDGHFNPRA